MRSNVVEAFHEVIGTITEKSCDYEGNNCYVSERTYPYAGVHVASKLERSDVVKSDHIKATPYAAVKETHTVMNFQLSRDYSRTVEGSGGPYYTRTDAFQGDIPWSCTLEGEGPEVSANKALVLALNRLADVKVQFGIAIAERAQTVALVGTYAKRIKALYNAFKARDVRKWKTLTGTSWKSATKQISNEYLAIQFGVLPILNDIQGLIEFMQENKASLPLVKVSGKDLDTSVSDKIVVLGVPGSSGEYMTVHRKTTWKKSVKVFLTFQPNGEELYRDLNRLGFANPVSLGIDLVRFSFVLEWVLGINAWAKTLTAQAGFNFVTGCTSTLSEAIVLDTVLGSYAHPSVGPRDTDPTVSGTATSSYKAMERIVLKDVPITTPFVKNPVGFFQAITSLALIAQGIELESSKPGRKLFRYRGKRARYLPPIQYVKGSKI